MSLLISGATVAPVPVADPKIAAQNAAVAAAAALWVGLRPTWTGFDGSVWRLTDLSGGVVLTRGGVRGMSMPPVVRFTPVVSPALHGTRNRGFRVNERDVFWPLYINHPTSSAGFIARDAAFWATMRPDQTGVWSITAPDGTTRSLTCRFMDDGNKAFDMLPSITGWTTYGVTLVAEAPFWLGTPVVRTFQAVNPLTPPPYPTSASSPPYVLYLSAGQTLQAATARNAGDVEAWPVWRLSGPFTSASVGVGAAQVVVPFVVAAGRYVTLNSDPASFTATMDDGTDVTNLLGQSGWASVPPGGEASLNLSIVGGAGSVSVTLTPRFLRAW